MKRNIFCITMALGYLTMLFVGITGKVPFFQMYSNSIRYSGYLWFYLGVVFSFLFMLGMDYWESNEPRKKKKKKTPRAVYGIPIAILFVVHIIRDFY